MPCSIQRSIRTRNLTYLTGQLLLEQKARQTQVVTRGVSIRRQNVLDLRLTSHSLLERLHTTESLQSIHLSNHIPLFSILVSQALSAQTLTPPTHALSTGE